MLNVHAFLNSVGRATAQLLDVGVQQEGRLEKLLGVPPSAHPPSVHSPSADSPSTHRGDLASDVLEERTEPDQRPEIEGDDRDDAEGPAG